MLYLFGGHLTALFFSPRHGYKNSVPTRHTKNLVEFWPPQRTNKIGSVFSRDMRVGKNSARPVNVRLGTRRALQQAANPFFKGGLPFCKNKKLRAHTTCEANGCTEAHEVFFACEPSRPTRQISLRRLGAGSLHFWSFGQK